MGEVIRPFKHCLTRGISLTRGLPLLHLGSGCQASLWRQESRAGFCCGAASHIKDPWRVVQSVVCRVKNVVCRVKNVVCRVKNVVWRVWSVMCRVWSVVYTGSRVVYRVQM